MIKLIGDNDVFEVLKLMNKSTEQNNYSFERNESKWISFLLNAIQEQNKNNQLCCNCSINCIGI